MPRLMKGLALAGICVAVVTVAVRFGSFVAGGSDSYCYVHQAERWASGRLLAAEPLALEAPWPDAASSFTPAGHIPSRTVPGAIAPICASGLSMLMALFLIAGGPGPMFFVIPLGGVLLVLATYVLGSRLGTGVGLASALVTAASPIVLFQVIQPMSDVPAAACWMLALAAVTSARRHGPALAGLSAAAAILIRPNLVPLGFVIGVFLLLRSGRPFGERLRHGAVYAAGAAVGCVAVAVIQQHFYGSPFSTGYGEASGLFTLAHLAPNASRYLTWLLQSETPLVVVALAAPFVLPRPLAWLCLGFCLANAGVYLPYLVFEDWSYLRFLLPAVPVLIVLTLGVIAALARRAGPRWVSPALTLASIALVMAAAPVARARHVFDLRQLESDFVRVGVAARRLPANALVITSRYSGSVRFYGRRRTLVWDVLDPASLDAAVTFAMTKGLEPYLVVASGEESAFRQRFAANPLARLDWPPMMEVAPQIRVYQPGARDRYFRGEILPTEYVR